MPERKPTGAATSSETSTSGCQLRIGCQPPPQRASTTRPKPMPPKRAVIHAARIQPARSRYLTSPGSPLFARADQILDECVELLLRERLAEGLRHDVLRVALLHVDVRIGDRRAHECIERLVRLLRVRRELVEVGAGRRRRSRGRERVARAAL